MKTIRSCHELGVCNGRPNIGCTCNKDAKPYAPGVIQSFKPKRCERAKGIAREVAAFALTFSVAALVMFLVWQVVRVLV